MIRRNLVKGIITISLMLFSGEQTWANILILPKSITEEALSESVPTAMAPSDFDVPDFAVQWHQGSLSGVKARLAENSLQWVRVSEVLVVPRARLMLEADDVEGGEVSNSGFNQSFLVNNNFGRAEIPIALISGEKNSIEVSIKRAGRILRGHLQIHFRPQKEKGPYIFIDPSCSPYNVSVEANEKSSSHWACLGCRLVRVIKDEKSTPSLEVLVFWDNVGQSVQIGEMDTDATLPSVWPLRLGPEPGKIKFASQGKEWVLKYQLPNRLHNTHLSLGLGPYSFSFRGDGNTTQSIVPLATLYGSHFLTETFRIVGFGVYTFEEHRYTDLGLYLYIENARLLDRRLGLNFLVGGHGIGFQALNQYYFTFTLPQGIELVYSDAFGRGKSLRLGAFIYPPISNNSYYNVWLRWGSSIFFELNYIAWQVQPNVPIFNSSTLGATVGFPLFQF